MHNHTNSTMSKSTTQSVQYVVNKKIVGRTEDTTVCRDTLQDTVFLLRSCKASFWFSNLPKSSRDRQNDFRNKTQRDIEGKCLLRLHKLRFCKVVLPFLFFKQVDVAYLLLSSSKASRPVKYKVLINICVRKLFRYITINSSKSRFDFCQVGIPS